MLTKYTEQVNRLSRVISAISLSTSKSSSDIFNATVLNDSTIRIDGSNQLTPYVSGASVGDRIQVKIENHRVVSAMNTVENPYDDTDLRTQLQTLSDTFNTIQESLEETEDGEDNNNIIDQLANQIAEINATLEENEDVDDEVSDALDELLDELEEDLETVTDLVDEIKAKAEGVDAKAEAAYNGVYPISSEMRSLFGDLFDEADADTAQTEELAKTYSRSGEYAQAQANYYYHASKSVVQWEQTFTAELEAWANGDAETQQKISDAKEALTSAKTGLVEMLETEIKAEGVYKNDIQKYNVAYKLYQTAITENNTEKIEKAKSVLDSIGEQIYGTGNTSDAVFTDLVSAVEAYEEAVNAGKPTSTTDWPGDYEQAVLDAYNALSGNDGSYYACLYERYRVARAQAEVDIATEGINSISSSTIKQTADSISLKVSSDELASEIKILKDAIDLKVSSDDYKSQIQQLDNRISSKVSSSDYSSTVTQLSNRIDTTLSTANSAANTAKTYISDVSNGTLVCKSGQTVGALVNANGSFDIVPVTWSSGNPTVGSTAYAQFNGTDVIFSNGVKFSSTGTEGLFYVGKTIATSHNIPAKQGWMSGSLTINQLMGVGNSTTSYSDETIAYLKAAQMRPVGLVRMATNHKSILKISGWNLNPGQTAQDTANTGLSFSVSRNGVSSTKSKQSFTLYTQILWVRSGIDTVSDIDIDEDETTDDGNEGTESVLSGYLKGSVSGSTLTLTIDSE